MSSEKQTWRIFLDTIPARGEPLSIEGDEHHYLSQVLRLKAGETIEVGDGRGVVATARLERVEKKRSHGVVLERREIAAPRNPVRLFVGQPKPAALDEAVSLAAELGAHEFHVVRTHRTSIKAPPRQDRLERLAQEATRITKSPWVMKIVCHESMDAALNGQDFGLALLCDESPLYTEQKNSHNHILSVLQRQETAVSGWVPLSLFVGPEASFTEEERNAIREKSGAVAVSLGDNILRVPTAVAGAVACAVGFLSYQL